MANTADEDQLKEIDAILGQEDPDFVKSLADIQPDALNNQVIAEASDESMAKYNRFQLFWKGLDRGTKQVFMFSGFLIFIALPTLYVAWKGIFTPQFEVSAMRSLERWADEKLDLNPSGAEKNLRDLSQEPEFLVEIPEQIFHIKPKRDIRFGRFSFYVQVASKKDLDELKSRSDEMLQTINGVLRQLDVDDFQGVDGKEAVRHRLLAALSKEFGPRIRNVRYKLLVFN